MAPSHLYRQQIDACRPGSHDLQLPELAELARAVESDPLVAEEFAAAQQADAVLCEALDSVVVPAGLADRLLANLLSRNAAPAEDRTPPLSAVANALSSATVAASEQAATQTAVEVEKPAPATRGSARRTWLLAAAALAAAVLLAVGVKVFQPSGPRTFDQNQLASQVDGWLRDMHDPTGWMKVGSAQLPPIDADIIPRAVRWRALSGESPEAGVIYDLTPAGQSPVLLLVVPTKDIYRVGPSADAFTKLTVTGGKQVVAWQKTGHLYVLSVGNGQRVKDFIRIRRLTALSPAANHARG